MARILVIEDEYPILQEVLEWLQFEGYDPLGAGNGQEGVELAVAHGPDVIVCDISMPLMDGYEVLLALRQRPETRLIPLIFLTARADKSFMRHGMELGADDYLTKPFTRGELLSAITSRLERRTQIAESYDQELEAVKLKMFRLVTHELKTPLSSVMFVRDVIDRQLGQLSNEQVRDLLQTLSVGTDRFQHVVQQTVYMTQLDSGVLNQASVQDSGSTSEFWHILPSAIDLGRHFAFRNRDGQITIDQRDPDAQVIGLANMLKHALAELIANALNFSPEDEPVSITQWKADDQIWLTIFDHGLGMSPLESEQAQRPFEQIDREKREQQGLGLGLSIARRIIELHSGVLQISSVAGKGTQVTVNFASVAPFQADQSDDDNEDTS